MEIVTGRKLAQHTECERRTIEYSSRVRLGCGIDREAQRTASFQLALILQLADAKGRPPPRDRECFAAEDNLSAGANRCILAAHTAVLFARECVERCKRHPVND